MRVRGGATTGRLARQRARRGGRRVSVGQGRAGQARRRSADGDGVRFGEPLKNSAKPGGALLWRPREGRQRGCGHIRAGGEGDVVRGPGGQLPRRPQGTVRRWGEAQRAEGRLGAAAGGWASGAAPARRLGRRANERSSQRKKTARGRASPSLQGGGTSIKSGALLNRGGGFGRVAWGGSGVWERIRPTAKRGVRGSGRRRRRGGQRRRRGLPPPPVCRIVGGCLGAVRGRALLKKLESGGHESAGVEGT